MIFPYGEMEIAHLKSKDKRLGGAIDRIGVLSRAVDDNLFSSLVTSIIGQQISSAAQKTIARRFTNAYPAMNPALLAAASPADLQRLGVSFRKAGYIHELAQKVASGEFDLSRLTEQSDRDVIETLTSLRGIGVWTAEMLMIFCMKRPNILSFGDLAIVRGMRMLYRHKRIDHALFERYRRRYDPYASVASLYLWAIAGGALPELTDPAPAKKPKASQAKGLRS